MKKYLFGFVTAFSILMILNLTVNASTAFMAAKGEKVLTGRNGDSKNLNVRMLVLPPSEGKHGRIYLGFEDGGWFVNTTGMNDQGLWYGSTSLCDGASLPERNDIKNYYNKPTIPYELCEKVLEECATVDEAIQIYATYFTPFWNGHTLIVDKFGNSVIVEFGEKDVVFIRRKNSYQVMTNFPNADTLNARWYNCYRYKTAESMLASSREISTDLFRSICDAVHLEGSSGSSDSSPTSLSTAYDVKNGNLFVYYFHYFEEVLVFNVFEEIAKGENYYNIPECYHQIQLKSPLKGELVNSSSVTFTWNGNAENYNLYYSVDPDFTNAEPIRISTAPFPVQSSVSFSVFCLGAFIFGLTLTRKRKAAVGIIGLTIVSVFLCCQINVFESPFSPSTIEHHQTVEKLQPQTFYYWKVVAIGAEGINSESIIQTFKTKN